MKAISADPKTVRKIFSDRYIIPDFQRPYSWETDQCDKLWEDLTTFFNDKKSSEDKYFLGNLVIHQNGDAFSVIDGQQRVTTLLLLLKALHQKAGTVRALEECIKLKDPLTSELTNELRINSLVLERDKEQLNDIIFQNGKSTDDSAKLKINYTRLSDKITEWWGSVNNSTDQLNELILLLLDQVVLLPIHCGSEDDALIIFETINNRGMSLTDADIFKAKLHRNSNSDKDKFIKAWNTLSGHEWLFRCYMHITRAKAGDVSKEMALRTFFSNKERLQDWKSVMLSITLVHEVNSNWQGPVKSEILWEILHTFTNHYWNFPLLVFLHKYGKLVDGEFQLSEEVTDDYIKLCEATIRYFFLKGVVHNSVNAVKDTAFKVCASIEQGNDFEEEYEKNIGEDFIEFERKILNKQYGRYLNGLVLISAYLNPKQDMTEYKTFMKGNYHIEHILPKKWNNYDKWTSETWEANLNTLGNLVPLEQNLNISAKNEFFSKKKEKYIESKVMDALDLLPLSDWHPEQFEKRHQDMQTRILNFFR